MSVSIISVKLAEWARRSGVHPQTAYRWFREGTMPDLLMTYTPHRDLLYSAVLADVLDSLGHRSSALPPTVRQISSA